MMKIRRPTGGPSVGARPIAYRGGRLGSRDSLFGASLKNLPIPACPPHHTNLPAPRPTREHFGLARLVLVFFPPSTSVEGGWPSAAGEGGTEPMLFPTWLGAG